MQSSLKRFTERVNAITTATALTLFISINPAVADDFRSDFPDDLSAECRAAIAHTRQTFSSKHRINIRYASVNQIPRNHPYYAASYNSPPHNLYLSLDGENEVYQGDIATQSTALNLLHSYQLLSGYAWKLVDQCETVGLVTFAMNEYQVRQMGLGEAGFTEFKCWEGMPVDTPVPCWNPD
ncbi:MAG: hypothetical protein AAF889_11405 [Cyanobacteria bacterium P01_D01_bin.73]